VVLAGRSREELAVGYVKQLKASAQSRTCRGIRTVVRPRKKPRGWVEKSWQSDAGIVNCW